MVGLRAGGVGRLRGGIGRACRRPLITFLFPVPHGASFCDAEQRMKVDGSTSSVLMISKLGQDDRLPIPWAPCCHEKDHLALASVADQGRALIADGTPALNDLCF